MTSGSSQGLFVIVSVVIFGIFVGISYLLFQDKMSTGLSNIFDESFFQVELMLSEKDTSDGDSVDKNKYNKSHSFRYFNLKIGKNTIKVSPTDSRISLNKKDYIDSLNISEITFVQMKVDNNMLNNGFNKEKQGFKVSTGINGKFTSSDYLNKYDKTIPLQSSISLSDLDLDLDISNTNKLELNIINNYGGVTTYKYDIVFN